MVNIVNILVESLGISFTGLATIATSENGTKGVNIFIPCENGEKVINIIKV